MTEEMLQLAKPFLDALHKNPERYDLPKIEAAYLYAFRAHAGQRRQSGEPYICHPIAVAQSIVELGLDTDSVCAALLHDTVEDCGTSVEDIRELFGDQIKTKFRPHHFPFTEPSCEVDVQCFECKGEGCRVCKGEGWIELLGAGMVHPKVLEGCGIDTSIYSGFAFGIGLERLTMRRFNISDMRLMYENDVRFLNQF